jgi:hypothetical protein
MSYTITKSNGTILTELVDGTTDQVHSSLTLVAKSASAYGTALNQNFVYLLENFANSVQPRTPIVGQLWFDTTQNRLKVYDGVNFKVSGGTIVSATAPSGINAGDIWIDSNSGQLRFNDGASTKLAGPVYTVTQGLSGFVIDSVIGTDQLTHTIASMYVGQTLLGIWSNTQFTPSTPISQYTGVVYVGFNASTFGGVKLRAPVSQADTLLAADGSIKTAENFISTSDDSATAGTLTINNATPLILGENGNSEITATASLFNIVSNTSGQNFKITTKFGSTQYPSLFVDATNNRIGIFNAVPTATLHIGTVATPGSVIIEGNLTVNGTTTSINSTTINIDDKNIELGSVASPTDTTANGGGFTLKGTTDKTFTWINVGAYWNSSENINLVTGKGYKINGTTVLEGGILGPTIVASSLTSVGTLTSLNVTNLSITPDLSGNVTLANSTPVFSNGNIVLQPKGTGVVSVSSFKISDVANPVAEQDAATKTYVDTVLKSRSVAISLTTTGLTNSQIAITYLAKLFPNTEWLDSSICRAVCTDGAGTAIRKFVMQTGAWVYQNDL